MKFDVVIEIHHSVQLENIQDSCQSSQEWTSRELHHKVILCKKKKKTPRATYQNLQALVSVLNVKIHDIQLEKHCSYDSTV